MPPTAAAIGRALEPARAGAWSRELAPAAAARVTAAFASDPSFRALGYTIKPEDPFTHGYLLALARTRVDRLAERMVASATVTGRRVHILRELARRARLGGWG